jgi:hypothetical protein
MSRHRRGDACPLLVVWTRIVAMRNMSMLIDKNTKVQTLRERSASHMSAIYASILAPSGIFGDDVMVYGGFLANTYPSSSLEITDTSILYPLEPKFPKLVWSG